MILEAGKQIIINGVNEDKIPGATYCFISDKYEEYGNYGYSQLVPEKIENNIDTLYDLASCSKVVATTTMILKLIEDQKISLDTKASDILTDFPFTDITIKMLLTHTSGMVGDDKAYKKTKSPQEMYEFIKKLPLAHKPGEMVDYSDFGYITLGLIIDKLTGSIEKYANELIFKPLGMENTMYNPYLKERKEDCAAAELTEDRGLIKGIVHDGKANILEGLSGNAGVFSTVKDLAKFAKMILNDGYPVLKKETIDQFKLCFTEGLNLHRTLGWCYACNEYACGSKYSNHAIFHTGFSGTSIYIDFDRKCAIILLTNRVHPYRRDVSMITSVRNAFHDALLEKYDSLC